VDTVHECDRQTDRRMDRRTDRITITDTVQTASHGNDSVRCFFTNEKCNEIMRWISLINKLFSDIYISQSSV